MKSTLATISLCLFCGCAFAGTIPLEWDRSPSAGVTAYRLRFCQESNFSAAPVYVVDVPDTNAATVSDTNLTAGNWFVENFAVAGVVESAPSNVLPFTVPASPGTLVIDMATNLNNPQWQQYFRLRIEP